MLDKSINSALLALRAQIIRDSLDGLDHVNALLVMRGVPRPRVPRKFAQRQDTSRLALEALWTGPKRGYEVARYAAETTGDQLPDQWRRMYQALHNLRRRGLVVKDGRVWRLRDSNF
jgi:hypothetical protein